jgi:hypothetical protein
MELSGSFQFTFFLASNWQQIFVFLVSWVVFYIVGALFLDYGIGQYHSSYLKRWVVICKALFLSTFVIACTLLELLTFEMLDVINPVIRQFLWTASFSMLCIILNVLIPGVLAATVCVHFNAPPIVTCVLSVASLVVFHSVTIFMTMFLPMQETKKDDPVHLGSKNIHNNELPHVSITDLFGFNFQMSISQIAIVGTVIAAIFAGFATVSFPIEQLVAPLNVNEESLKERQAFLQSVVLAVSKKKKVLVVVRRKSAVVKSRKFDGTIEASDVESGGMFTPLASPAVKSSTSDSGFPTPIESPYSISNSNLSAGLRSALDIHGKSSVVMQRHLGLGNTDSEISTIEYSVEDLEESVPSTPSGSNSKPLSFQQRYIGFGQNNQLDSSESFEDLAPLESRGSRASSGAADVSNLLQINRNFSSSMTRGSLTSWISYKYTHWKLRLHYNYTAFVRWGKTGCSPVIALKCMRSAGTSLFVRAKFLASGLYHESRSRFCSIRSKPRHVSPIKSGYKCAACVNKATCEHYAQNSSWIDVAKLVCYNNMLWLQFEITRAAKYTGNCVSKATARFKSTVLGIETLNSGDEGDDMPLFPTSENRQALKLFNEISIVEREIRRLETLCDELLDEIVCMRESLEKTVLNGTYWGIMLRVSGQFLTLMGVFRFLIGGYRVYLYITAGRYVTVSQQSDNVSSFLEFVVIYLRLNIDLEPWSPILSTLYVGCMTLLHIRAFMISTEQFAKLGVLSTSTEIYSLVLAYVAGSYSVAGVMFLRTQLPRYRRKSVTAALGENLVLDFYFWLFDVLFILSTTVSCWYFYVDVKRKKRLNDAVSNNQDSGGGRVSNTDSDNKADADSSPRWDCNEMVIKFIDGII